MIPLLSVLYQNLDNNVTISPILHTPCTRTLTNTLVSSNCLQDSYTHDTLIFHMQIISGMIISILVVVVKEVVRLILSWHNLRHARISLFCILKGNPIRPRTAHGPF